MIALKRIVGILLGSFVLFLLLCAGLVIWLTTTDSGTHTWSKNLQDRWPQLKMQNLSGNLVDGFYAEQLVYAGSPRIEVDQLHVDLSLWPLLDLQRLEFNQLHAQAVRIISAQTSAASPSQAPEDFRTLPAHTPLPALPTLANVFHTLQIPKVLLPVQIDDLKINRMSFDDFLVEDFLLRSTWSRRQVQADVVRGNIAGVLIDTQLSVTTDDIPEVSLTGRWQFENVFADVSLEGTFTQLTGSHNLRWSDGALDTTGSIHLMPEGLIHTQLKHTSFTPELSVSADLTGNGVAWTGQAEGQAFTREFTARLTGRITPVIEVTVDQAIIDKHANVSGTFKYLDNAPQVEANVTVKNLANWLPAVDGPTTAEFTWKNSAYTIVAASKQLQIQTYPLQDVRLSADGDLNQLRYKTTWDSGQLKGSIESLQQNPVLHIDAGAVLQHNDFSISNQQSFSLRQLDNQWQVSAHCWQGIGEFCVTQTLVDLDHTKVDGTLSKLTLGLLNPYLPVTIDAGSMVSGDWQLQLQPGNWQVAGHLKTENFALEYGDTPPPLPDIDITFTADATKASISAKAENEQISWQGDLSSLGYSAQSLVTARLTIETQPSWLANMVPAIKQIEGSIDAVLDIEGPISEPRLVAQGQWRAGTLAWKTPEFKLKDINAQIQASPDTWQISGDAVPQTGGTLNISAQGNGYTPSANITAMIKGKGLTLEEDNWKVSAAPDVTLAYADNNILITGRTDIPDALIELSTLPSNLPRPIEDVRIVDRPALPRDNGQTSINGKVDVRLGENVLLELLALKVRLTGELTAEFEDGEVTGLYGELSIADGSLTASGQSLRVQEGRLLFSGNPNNPYVDLIAVRTITDQSPALNVGLRISGRADNLNTVVYSDPAMSETRALSFLVLGRDFNEQSETDSQQLMIAAIGFGLSQTQGVVQQLRNSLGLDELSALAAEQNDIAIVAGKRINDNLYVRYSYNALSAVGALIIRYYLTDRWRLEATNDLNSSMDLLYELKR